MHVSLSEEEIDELEKAIVLSLKYDLRISVSYELGFSYVFYAAGLSHYA